MSNRSSRSSGWALACVLPIFLALFAGGSVGAQPKDAAQEKITKDKETGGNPVVMIETSMGEIQVELDAQKAPITVENFLRYVDEGFYDGTIFHRVIPGFMIQGGGFTADMDQKKTGDTIKNEAGNGLENDRGTLAMARTSVVDSATAQFFINLVDNDFLNHRSPDPGGYGYAVFGRVTSGMDVVDRIAGVGTGSKGGHQDVPLEPVTLVSVKRAK